MKEISNLDLKIAIKDKELTELKASFVKGKNQNFCGTAYITFERIRYRDAFIEKFETNRQQ